MPDLEHDSAPLGELTKHTPGPWLYFQDEEDCFDDDQIIITTEDRMYHSMVPVAKVSVEYSEEFDAEQRANARIIAAAPDMLVAGIDLIAALDPDALDPEQFNAWCALERAIEKAKGGAA